MKFIALTVLNPSPKAPEEKYTIYLRSDLVFSFFETSRNIQYENQKAFTMNYTRVTFMAPGEPSRLDVVESCAEIIAKINP